MTFKEDAAKNIVSELQDERRKNSRLLDLLMLVKRELPESAGRVDDLIFQAQQTKQCLDRVQSMIDIEKLLRGTTE
jgi:hypothetical protein